MKPFDLAVNEWWKAPVQAGSKISDIYASPDPGPTRSDITHAWGGCACDTARGDLLIGGGGHTDYYGNEQYAQQWKNPLSPNFLKWRIKNYYSFFDGVISGVVEAYPDGTPSAHHGYCAIHYHPDVDKLYRLPGNVPVGDGGRTIRTYRLACTVESPSAPDASAWVRPSGSDLAFGSFIFGSPGLCGFNRVNRLLYEYADAGLETFDTATEHWTIVAGGENGPIAPSNTSACITDTTPQYFINLGGAAHGCQVRRLDTFAFLGGGESGFGASGATAIQAVSGPGVLWDVNGQSVVAWAGLLAGGTDRRDLYRLDIGGAVWNRTAGTGDVPPVMDTNGVRNRFQYLEDGLAALVNSTTEETYFVRLSPSTAPTAGPPYKGNLLLMGAG